MFGRLPIVVAPMAGGPTTPALVAAVDRVGALGFLAAGYLRPEQLDELLTEVEQRGVSSYGVNLFLPSPRTADEAAIFAYRRRLEPLAAAAGVELGEPRWDDDHLAAKVDVVCAHRPSVVSFTFAAPPADVCARVRTATGATIVATVTSPAEAVAAQHADALCVQGIEAGAHRGVWDDDVRSPDGGNGTPLLPLLTQVRAVSDLPMIATGGISDGAGIQAVLDAGAAAAQLGTAFLCCPEAGTSATHRQALRDPRFASTAVTRAYTGRPARGLVNAFIREHSEHAPAGYPNVHYLTRPLRQAAAASGDADLLHLWAGTGWQSISESPAAEIVARLERERSAAAAQNQGSDRGLP